MTQSTTLGNEDHRRTRWFGHTTSRGRFPISISPGKRPASSELLHQAKVRRPSAAGTIAFHSHTVRHGDGTPTTNEASPLVAMPSDPWQKYERVIHVRQGHEVTLAYPTSSVEKDADQDVAISQVSSSPGEAHLFMLNSVRSPAFLQIFEVYDWGGSLFCVAPYISTSVLEISLCPSRKATEAEVACVMDQTLVGLCFLQAQGLVHGDITASNILVTHDGVAKIAHWQLNCCQAQNTNGGADVQGLGVVASQLMDIKALAGNREPVPGEPVEWSSSARDFIRATQQKSAQQVAKHHFLGAKCRPRQLRGLVLASGPSSYRHWRPIDDNERAR